MPKNHQHEPLVAADNQETIKHIQRLIVCAEKCAKTKGKRSLFGGDKFKPAKERFHATLRQCVEALIEDGKVDSLSTAEEEMAAVDSVLSNCRSVSGNWRLAFQFWEHWYACFLAQLPTISAAPSSELKEWLEKRDLALRVKQSIAKEGGHIMLSQEVYDAGMLPEPLRSEAITHMRRLRKREI